jgi:uncharacterized peroxidase-related enzyme
MPRIDPLPRESLAEFEPVFELIEATMGFIPSSLMAMGRWPDLLRAFVDLAGRVLGPGEVEPGLKNLVSFVSSNAAGCRYCQAHTSHTAVHQGVSAEKVDAAFEFETSPLFDDRERAALRLARDASLVPNLVEDAHFAELRRHFTEREIIEIVSVIALFGYLNRWNDTVATQLESLPASFAAQQLTTHGWKIDKHGPS